MTMSNAWQEALTAMAALAGSDEVTAVEDLRRSLAGQVADTTAVTANARRWVEALRERGPSPLGLEALLLEYRLDTPEGVALMCLAEALLRMPDPAAADRLIRDLLSPLAWETHIGHSPQFFVNAASWGLALTGRLLAPREQPDGRPQDWLTRLVGRLGEPLLRQALRRTMGLLAGQFVLGETLAGALARARTDWQRGITHSFDMLGEAALTTADSTRYLTAYSEAIDHVGSCDTPAGLPRPGISIKLSALHPRYGSAHWQQLQTELLPALADLCRLAAARGVDLSIDAEESARLELSLQVLTALLERLDPAARRRVGMVVQAYGRRAPAVLTYLHSLATGYRLRLPVRLVKGAYWDTEIKRAQQLGLDAYPVFTRKQATDLSYLACARQLLQHPQQFHPQFATHNALTVAALAAMAARSGSRIELQRLQGMGAALHELVQAQYPQWDYRIYAPVGPHRELLPYLVRRLLENGANTSFIHQLFDPDIPVDTLLAHPLTSPTDTPLPPPPALFLPLRRNAPGLDLHLTAVRDPFLADVESWRRRIAQGAAEPPPSGAVSVCNPADGSCVGQWQPAAPADVDRAIDTATAAWPAWAALGVDARAGLLERAADSLWERRAELVALTVLETGKTLENALADLREAIDMCLYYAGCGRRLLGDPVPLPGPVGERNDLWLRPRGIFAAISPWNFPLAIFTGQVAAALVAGNAVVAKPAEQATLVARRVAGILYAAGIPAEILQLVPGAGETVGAALCAHPGVDGVVFTGGFDTAKAIQRLLAERPGAIVPLIAETAGLNCLIADSSAQPQQLVQDVLRSAFDSAGQRCSALRVLFLPDTTAPDIEKLLIAALATWRIGDPLQWSTDIGPVIDGDAHRQLRAHVGHFQRLGQVLYQGDVPTGGWFFPPTVIRLESLDELQAEAFGPILHVIRYREADIDALTDTINASGFGLTCGIHSRNAHHAHTLAARIRAGNCYINRDMIGAVVGSQPFGGRGKSGTGPKAGGPHYLLRFVTEQTVTENTAALGGDPMLLATGRQ